MEDLVKNAMSDGGDDDKALFSDEQYQRLFNALNGTLAEF